MNIYSQEIESALLQFAGLADAGVVGVADENLGERPVAFIAAETEHDAQALHRDLRAFCEAWLGRIRSPVGFHFVHQLPRSPTDKLLRRKLRERLSQVQPPDGGGR